jgi:hypothetical protein
MPWHGPGETPDPGTAALPTARPMPLHLAISEPFVYQHCNVSVRRAGAPGTVALQALAILEEVAEGNQSRGVGVHGRSIMAAEAQAMSQRFWRDSRISRHAP